MLKKILPHICIIISVCMFAFLIVDQINSAVNFINQGSKIIFMILCLLTVVSSILFIGEMRK